MIDVSKTDWTKIYNYATKIVQMYRDKLRIEKVDASGELSRTADFDVEFNDYHLAVYFILESYYLYVEQGRNKSTGKFGTWVSKITDIERWLKQKIARGTFIPSHGHTIPKTSKEIRSVSYLIARKITRFGFYGHTHYGKHPLKDAIEEADRLGIIDEIVDCVVRGFYGRVDIAIEGI